MSAHLEEKTKRFQIVPLEERIAPSLLSICISIGFGGKNDGCDGGRPPRDPCYEPPKDPCYPKSRW